MTDPALEPDPDALAPGTRLAEFEIERVLGVGGFGIVYLAFDHALERHVALKEYMPAALAARRSDARIAVRSEVHAKTFGIGLRSFVNEARLLARFDHPALVKVYRFWEDNGTAYMVMPFYEGQTLASARAAMASPPNEAWLLALADAVLGALEALHREQVYHRDVAPDNILLQADGSAVLLDFGAARRVIGDRTQSLTAILKPNFAPIEQYGDSQPQRQGPWSDLYSLAAVLHYCLIGRAPVPAALRMLHDELPSLLALQDELVAEDGSHYSTALLGAIDAALAVRPEARPQHVAVFRAALRGEAPPAADLVALPPPLLPAVVRAPGREPFAATEVRLRRLDTMPAVTTAWSTIGPDRRAAAPAASKPVRGRAGAATGSLPSLLALPRSGLALIGVAPLMLAGLIGFWSGERQADEAVLMDTPPVSTAAGPSLGVSSAEAATRESKARVAALAQTPVAPTVAAAEAPAVPAPELPTAASVSPSAKVVARREVVPAGAERRTTAVEAKAPEPVRVAPRPAREAAADETAAAMAAMAEAPPARPERARVTRSRPVAAQTARQSCGDRNIFSMAFCLQRQCGQPEFAQDAECLDLRERQAHSKPSF